MDSGLLETAAKNFGDAQVMKGTAQLQRIALGLAQVARAARGGWRDNGLLETAARNFSEAQTRTGPSQMESLAVGLLQLARALKH